MNELIRKFERESHIDILWGQALDRVVPQTYSSLSLNQIEKVKTVFAELIVRECAGACLHDDWEDPRWGRFYANKIREHFGVEE